MIRFRNVQDGGVWKPGGIYTFEFLEYLSPPANGVAYVADESVTRASLMTNAGLFGEDSMPVEAVLDFASGYGSLLSQIYADEEYSWLGAASGYIEVIQTELVEETDDGDWYRATVKVAEDAPLGHSEINSIHLEGAVLAIMYTITGGAEGHILYLDGDVTSAFGPSYVITFDITGSTCNDGSYTGYNGVVYNAPQDRTQIWLHESLPCTTYDGYVTNVVVSEVPT